MVEAKVWITPHQFIQIREIAHDMINLGDALPVGCVFCAPKPYRPDVHVLAIDIDPFLLNQLVEVFHRPLPGVVVAKIQEFVRSVSSQQPFRMMRVEPRFRRCALRLKPNYALDALRMREISDCSKAARKSLL